MPRAIIESAEPADLAELVKLGAVVHTRATDRQTIRGPLTPEEIAALGRGESVPGASAPRLSDELDTTDPERPVPTGRKVIHLDEGLAAKLDDDAEVARAGLDPARVQSMRARRRAVAQRGHVGRK